MEVYVWILISNRKNTQILKISLHVGERELKSRSQEEAIGIKREPGLRVNDKIHIGCAGLRGRDKPRNEGPN
jgi:hypothetical protein